MRKSFVATVAIVTALAIATPAAAAPRERDRSEPPSIVRFVKNVMKKVFKIGSTSVPIIPIPEPDKP